MSPVVLNDDQQARIERLMETGRFEAAGDVIGEGLRLLEEREQQMAALRDAIRAGRESGISDLSVEDIIARTQAAIDAGS